MPRLEENATEFSDKLHALGGDPACIIIDKYYYPLLRSFVKGCCKEIEGEIAETVRLLSERDKEKCDLIIGGMRGAISAIHNQFAWLLDTERPPTTIAPAHNTLDKGV